MILKHKFGKQFMILLHNRDDSSDLSEILMYRGMTQICMLQYTLYYVSGRDVLYRPMRSATT